MAPLLRIVDKTNTRQEQLKLMLRSLNPDMLATKVVAAMDNWDVDECTFFAGACILAAGFDRKRVEDYILGFRRVKVLAVIEEQFTVRGKLNYPALNFTGHLLMAGGFRNTNQTLHKMREYIGGFSIWESDAEKRKCSDEYLYKYGALALAYPYESAYLNGRKMVDKYLEINRRDTADPPVFDESYKKIILDKSNTFYVPSEVKKAEMLKEEKLREELEEKRRKHAEMEESERIRKEEEVLAEAERIKKKREEEAERSRKLKLAADAVEMTKFAVGNYNREKRKLVIDDENKRKVVQKKTVKQMLYQSDSEDDIVSDNEEQILKDFKECFKLSDEDMNKFNSDMISAFKKKVINKRGKRKISDYREDSEPVQPVQSVNVSVNENNKEKRSMDGLLNTSVELSGMIIPDYDSFGESTDSEVERQLEDIQCKELEVVKKKEYHKPDEVELQNINFAEDRSRKRRLKDSDSDNELGSVKKRIKRLSF